jgi:hypothetical protein
MTVGSGANPVGTGKHVSARFSAGRRGMRIATDLPMTWLLVRGLLLGALLVACGGHTEGGTSDDPAESGDASGSDKNGGDGKGDGSGSPIEGDTALGECVLGFPPYSPEGGSCPWLADNLCYESRDMACNCVCPRDRDSQCASGFEGGPDSRVEVYCY